MKLICWLKTIWRTLPTLWFGQERVMGHDYVEIEKHKNVEVQVLKCEVCGEVSIGWNRSNPTKLI